MCMCGKPVINGQPGYSWDGKSTGTRPVNPPDLLEKDTLVYDEPGRCGGLDSHCHHFRIVWNRFGDLTLIVRHGGGDERMDIQRYKPGIARLITAMNQQDTHGRYWLMHLLWSLHEDAVREATSIECGRWESAAVEKRIKIRRRGGRSRAEIIRPVAVGETA